MSAGEPMTATDLDELERLRAEATQGEWIDGERLDWCAAIPHEEHADIYRVVDGENRNIACATFGAADAAYVVALVNAAPDLFAELRRLREREAAWREAMPECDHAICDRKATRWSDVGGRNFCDEHGEDWGGGFDDLPWAALLREEKP